jgi:hypothetical protein
MTLATDPNLLSIVASSSGNDPPYGMETRPVYGFAFTVAMSFVRLCNEPNWKAHRHAQFRSRFLSQASN